MPAERLEEIFSQELKNKIILNTSLMNESLAIYYRFLQTHKCSFVFQLLGPKACTLERH